MVHALIFDMDGTMIDSMPSHKRSWAEFAQRQGLDVDISEVMRRTTGRTGIECMRILFGRPDMGEDEAMAHVHVKEAVYRELFSPIFAEVAGFKAFFDHAHARGLKLGVGTAGDRQNQAFAYQHLQMKVAPLTTVGGDEGLPGKPEPAIFLEAARRMGVEPERCIVFEDAPLGIEAARRAVRLRQTIRAVRPAIRAQIQSVARRHRVAPKVRARRCTGTARALAGPRAAAPHGLADASRA